MAHPRIPLIRLDAGWLFIIAGLVACIGCVLVSADTELQMLRVQKSLLHAQEQTAFARIRAHEDFLERLENPDDSLTRRLAATELNLMPMDDEPVLRLVSFELPTVEWIDRQVEPRVPMPVLANTSLLTKFATGPNRLWLFGGGMMCVFIGLLLDPSASRVRRRLIAAQGGVAFANDSKKSTSATALLEPEAQSQFEFADAGEATAIRTESTEDDDHNSTATAAEDEEVEDEVFVDEEAVAEEEELDNELDNNGELRALEDDADDNTEDDVQIDDGAEVEESDEDDVELVEMARDTDSVSSDVEALESDDDADVLEEVAEVDSTEEECSSEAVIEVKSIAAPPNSVLSIRPPVVESADEPGDDSMASDEYDAIDEMPNEDWNADVPPDDFADETLEDTRNS